MTRRAHGTRDARPACRARWLFGDVDPDADVAGRGRVSGTIEILDDGPYFVVVSQDVPGEVTARASGALLPYVDPDDGAVLTPGTTTMGLMDYPGDLDTLHLRLEAGTTVTLTVDTISFGPDVAIERSGSDDYLVRMSDVAGIDTGA